MFEVSELATEKLNEYLQANNINSSLRVALMPGGCSGPALGLALDEKKEGDEQFDKDAISFLVEKALLTQCGTISVDYVDAGQRSGFSITSQNPIPGSGGGCSSGSCGSCGC